MTVTTIVPPAGLVVCPHCGERGYFTFYDGTRSEVFACREWAIRLMREAAACGKLVAVEVEYLSFDIDHLPLSDISEADAREQLPEDDHPELQVGYIRKLDDGPVSTPAGDVPKGKKPRKKKGVKLDLPPAPSSIPVEGPDTLQ